MSKPNSKTFPRSFQHVPSWELLKKKVLKSTKSSKNSLISNIVVVSYHIVVYAKHVRIHNNE